MGMAGLEHNFYALSPPSNKLSMESNSYIFWVLTIVEKKKLSNFYAE